MRNLIVGAVLFSLLGVGGYTLLSQAGQAGQPTGKGPMEQGMMGQMGPGMGMMGGQGGMGMMGGMMGQGMGMMGPGMMGPMMMSPELMGTMMAIHGEMMSMMGQMMQKYGSQMEQMTPELR
jgi:hypothetical protein